MTSPKQKNKKVGGKKHHTRRAVVEALYQALMKETPLNAADIIDDYLAWRIQAEWSLPLQKSFFAKLIECAIAQEQEKNLSVIACAIVMAGKGELSMNETPRPVILNEYVTLASQLCDLNEVGVINALLDKKDSHA